MENDDLSAADKNSFCKHKEKLNFNALASPTSPLQFEFRHAQTHTQFDEAARTHIQLLNYIRSLQGVHPIPQQDVSRRHHHPTIALLQQRFQRLERDKELRQARQLETSRAPVSSVDLRLSLHLENSRSSSHSDQRKRKQVVPIKTNRCHKNSKLHAAEEEVDTTLRL